MVCQDVVRLASIVGHTHQAQTPGRRGLHVGRADARLEHSGDVGRFELPVADLNSGADEHSHHALEKRPTFEVDGDQIAIFDK